MANRLHLKNLFQIKQINFSKIICSALLVVVAFFSFASLTFAQQGTEETPQTPTSSLPLPDIGGYRGLVQDPGTVASVDVGVASLIVGAVMNIRFLLGAIAIAMILYSGFRLVTSQGNEEIWGTAKKSLIWSIIGLALVGFSGEIVRIFAVGNCAELGMLPGSNNVGCVPGGFLRDPNAIIQRSTVFNQNVQYIITFIKYFIGGIAVLMLMRNAIRLVTNSSEDELEKDKSNIVASIIGLFLIIIADPIINNVFFDIDTTRYPGTTGAQPGLNVAQGISEIVGFTNFLVSILTPVAIMVVVAGGIMYASSAGNEDTQGKAKRMITLALIGLLIIYGAFAIVSTFISGQFEAVNTTAVAPGQTTTNINP
ncbi:MAG: hypothetical protein ACRCZE_02790 [Candidatus Altimarinota bacterium]